MGVDIYGWVEVQDPTTHGMVAPSFPLAWNGVIEISHIVERSYNVFGYFFDVHSSLDIEWSVAGRRGLPPHVSQEAETGRMGPPQVWCAQTWITAHEVRAARQQDLFEMPPGWSLLFKLMDDLAAVYGDERVRLVVWFDSDPDSG